MFVPEHRYILTEYDPQTPWIVVAARHLTVDLGPGESFAEWGWEAVAVAPVQSRARAR